MLTIRDAQMQVFRRRAIEDFRRRLLTHLTSLLPTGTSPEAIREFMDQVLDDCTRYSIHRECDIARYAELLCGRYSGRRAGTLSKRALNLLLAHGVPAESRLGNLAELWSGQTPD